MAVARFTEAWVRGAPEGQYTDGTLPGFMCVVGKTRTTWYAQAHVRGGRQTKVRVGHWPDVPQVEARRMAADALAAMRRGEDPGEAERARRARSTTLAEALEAHLSGRARSGKTAAGYRYALAHYLPDWMTREVEAIGRDRAAVRERHRRIGRAHGAPTADSVMRVLRAVYNRAFREHPDLPPNPCGNVDFGSTRRRRVDLDPAALLAWGPAALALDPVRRDLQLFLILSGMRSGAARSARAEHLLPGRGLLRVLSPKGGGERAFDLPLSPSLLDLLSARAARGGWLFPARSASGHIEEVRDDALAPLVGHALRHAYTSLALEAGVPLLELKILLNHSVAGLGVTGTYVHLGHAHLREAQSRASAGILRGRPDALGRSVAAPEARRGRSWAARPPRRPDPSRGRVRAAEVDPRSSGGPFARRQVRRQLGHLDRRKERNLAPPLSASIKATCQLSGVATLRYSTYWRCGAFRTGGEMDLHLTRLKEMHPLLSTSTASEYAYRAAVGLARHGHLSGANLKISLGSQSHQGQLHWAPAGIGEEIVLDFNRVTEDTAEAITLALVSVARGWVVRRRLQRGEFADWLLADKKNRPVALEISGVDKADVGLRRLRLKVAQVRESSVAAKKGACVVELRPPRTRLEMVR